MSKAQDTDVPVEAIETITADELNDRLNEPVTMTIDTTLYGFITTMALLQRESEAALDREDLIESLELNVLLSQIESENEAACDGFEEVNDYLLNDRVTGEATDGASFLP